MRKSSLIFFLAMLLFVGGFSFWLLKVKDSDLSFYQGLKEGSSNLKKREDPLFSYSEQVRKNVVKELWFSGERFRIESESSELFFFQKKGTLEVVEELGPVKCFIQEELFYRLSDGREVVKEGERYKIKGETNIFVEANDLLPMQNIRYLEAEKATYNYTTKLFLAENVKMWKYRIESHELPSSLKSASPLMSGVAKSAEFLLKENEKVRFVVQDFKVSFIPKKGEI